MDVRGGRQVSRRGGLRRKSAMEWTIRGLLAVLLLIVGYIGMAQTLAFASGSDVKKAYALAPWSGRIAASLALQLSKENASAAERRQADRLARLALRRDPTAVAAIAALGVNTQLNGDTATARRLFAYSETLSRRDLMTQLWAIEDAVGRGDVTGALRHYDIALRTSSNAPDLLYPVLGSAVTDPSVRAALLRTLVARPAWGESFVNYVAGNGADAKATAALFSGLKRAGFPVAVEASAVVISALILNNHWDLAWNYYASVRPGADRNRSRDPYFKINLGTPSPFDWTPVNDAGVITSIQQGDRGGIFVFNVTTSTGGTLLQQVQMLPPGPYKLIGRSSGIDQPEGSRPYWSLSCREGQELGRISLPNSTQDNGRFAGVIRVPINCTVQTLTLVARPSDMVSGVGGQIDAVQLLPAGGQ